MSARGAPRLVLDAHGVVFSNPLPAFLREVVRETGQDPDEFRLRWREEIRRDAWLSREPDARLWERITRGVGDADAWRARLEGLYAPGPAAPHLARWRDRAPLWLLSNHRSAWLLPRLERFGFERDLDRVLVSDEVRAVKPEPAAFRAALEGLESSELALVVDDRKRNVRAARDLGIPAVRARDDDEDWVTEVDAWLDRGGR